MARRAFHEQPRLELAIELSEPRCGGVHTCGIRWWTIVGGCDGSRSTAQVLQRAARNPQQEQVQDGEKAELEADRNGLEHREVPPGLLQLERDNRRAEL